MMKGSDLVVYLNGEIVPHAEARVPVDDRGFLFADGVYEVVRVYDGRPLLLDEHLERLGEGLAAIEIRLPRMDLAGIARRLIEQNDLGTADATIYVQVTRGVAPRKHAFPEAGCEPTVFIAARAFKQHPDSYFDDGVAAIAVGDDRWARCDIKSVSLLPNVLANQRAHAAGAFEALYVRDGILIEGSHSNLFGVLDGQLLTYPACNYILNGITRRQVLSFARELGIPGGEGLLPLARLAEIEELFLSGTTTEVMPIVRLDGRPIDDGEPGPITQALQKAYRAALAAL
ncbi:MAG: D-amino acid aminotransferase [Longimicrobiales bacterium]